MQNQGAGYFLIARSFRKKINSIDSLSPESEFVTDFIIPYRNSVKQNFSAGHFRKAPSGQYRRS